MKYSIQIDFEGFEGSVSKDSIREYNLSNVATSYGIIVSVEPEQPLVLTAKSGVTPKIGVRIIISSRSHHQLYSAQLGVKIINEIIHFDKKVS